MRPVLIATVIALTYTTVSATNIARDSFLENAAITSAIQHKQTKVRMLAPVNVKVTTDKHVAKLVGVIDSETQYAILIRLVADTEGVKRVDSSALTLKKTTTPLEDKVIHYASQLKLAKYNASHPKQPMINRHLLVEARNHKLYVVGDVASFKQKKALMEILHSIPDIKEIVTDVVIKKPKQEIIHA